MKTDQTPAAGGAASSHTVAGPAPSVSAKGDSAFTILKSGFGVRQGCAWVVALVRNDSTRSGGTVTISFNLLDATGAILATESQVETFPRPGAVMSIGTQATVPPGAKPARVETTGAVKWPGIGSQDPFPMVPTSPVKIVDSYGSYSAQATLTNPLPTALESPRVSVICYNAAGVPIGGGIDFPDLVAPSGRVLVNASLLTTGRPARCDMSVSAPA